MRVQRHLIPAGLTDDAWRSGSLVGVSIPGTPSRPHFDSDSERALAPTLPEGTTAAPAFGSVSLAELEALASATDGAVELADLASFFRIEVGDADRAAVLRILEDQTRFASVWPESSVGPPPKMLEQTEVSAAMPASSQNGSLGINATSSQVEIGTALIVDVEGGWGTNAALPPIDDRRAPTAVNDLVPQIAQIWGLAGNEVDHWDASLRRHTRISHQGHGTAVLSLLVGKTGLGLVPNATVRLVSTWRSSALGPLSDIQTVRDALAFGSVFLSGRPSFTARILLVEVQIRPFGMSGPFMPVESDPAICVLLAAASLAGIDVVQAGGNGHSDLDTVEIDGTFPMNRNLGRHPSDSGSILVGAGTLAEEPGATRISNYGSRIDVVCPGQGVLAAGDGWSGWEVTDAGRNVVYANGDPMPFSGGINHFGGTSGASAIAAAGVARLRLTVPAIASLTPIEMRAFLRKSGRPVAGGSSRATALDITRIQAEAAKPTAVASARSEATADRAVVADVVARK